MQSVHVNAYMIRTVRGHYAKTDTGEGIGYVMFRTRKAADKWAEEHGQGCYVVSVRAAITPTNTRRTARMVALQKARAEVLSAKRKVEHNFYP
jgi:hypothetical protein